ncbi:CD209 antigen-like protein 2 [Patiria miniata]|uniref:C-type lectin domain-containing protein n=1 Tax=Patiria miniata TaxID=46514 RepID=A0A913Z8A2_PATMI|nr:CD209 antigen-like protein 2 [Patiria miniata]
MACKVYLKILNTAAFILFVVGVSGLCPRDWFEHGTSCYMTDSVIRNWDDGAAYCDRLGGELLVIETWEENKFIQGIVKNQNKRFTWLGCSDRDSEGQWLCYKDSASSLPFENWSTKEPNNRGGDDDCMSFYMENGKWSDSKCYSDKVYTVCETTSTQGKGEGVIIPSSSAAPVSCYTFGSDGRLQV